MENTVSIEVLGNIGHVEINRPTKSNALTIEMMMEITDGIDELNRLQHVDYIVITGKGKHFCAGADLGWMKNKPQGTYDEVYGQSKILADMFKSIFESKKLVITMINGACIGGGIGIVAASDIAIGQTDSFYAFPEVKHGLLPATILPYVIKRTGRRLKPYMLMGNRFSADKAYEVQLIDWVVKDAQKTLDEVIEALEKGEKGSQHNIKNILNQWDFSHISNSLIEKTIEEITAIRLKK